MAILLELSPFQQSYMLHHHPNEHVQEALDYSQILIPYKWKDNKINNRVYSFKVKARSTKNNDFDFVVTLTNLQVM